MSVWEEKCVWQKEGGEDYFLFKIFVAFWCWLPPWRVPVKRAFCFFLSFSSKMSASCKQSWHLHGENTTWSLTGSLSGIHIQRRCLDWLYRNCLEYLYHCRYSRQHWTAINAAAVAPQPLPQSHNTMLMLLVIKRCCKFYENIPEWVEKKIINTLRHNSTSKRTVIIHWFPYPGKQ